MQQVKCMHVAVMWCAAATAGAGMVEAVWLQAHGAALPHLASQKQLAKAGLLARLAGSGSYERTFLRCLCC